MDKKVLKSLVSNGGANAPSTGDFKLKGDSGKVDGKYERLPDEIVLRLPDGTTSKLAVQPDGRLKDGKGQTWKRTSFEFEAGIVPNK
jgi:hypothetical protein